MRYPLIQNHALLGKRYRGMARARLRKVEGDRSDSVYISLIGFAEDHERKSTIYGKKRNKNFIMKGH